MNKNKIIALTGLFIALCYIGTMFNIPIQVGAAKSMIHLGNVFCLFGAIVLGPIYGAIAASIGMGLFDIFNGWLPYVPSTFILKFCIAFITGTVYMRLKKREMGDNKRVIFACLSGMLFNIIFSPIAAYLTSNYILATEKEVATIITAWQSINVFINAVLATVTTYFLHLSLKKYI